MRNREFLRFGILSILTLLAVFAILLLCPPDAKAGGYGYSTGYYGGYTGRTYYSTGYGYGGYSYYRPTYTPSYSYYSYPSYASFSYAAPATRWYSGQVSNGRYWPAGNYSWDGYSGVYYRDGAVEYGVPVVTLAPSLPLAITNQGYAPAQQQYQQPQAKPDCPDTKALELQMKLLQMELMQMKQQAREGLQPPVAVPQNQPPYQAPQNQSPPPPVQK